MRLAKLDVINIIKEQTIAECDEIKIRFIEHIKHLYQYAIFKNLLDFINGMFYVDIFINFITAYEFDDT